MCGESRTHGSEGVVEGRPSTTTLQIGLSIHAGLRDFGAKFRIKKSPVQFAHGFGLLEPRPHWVKIGCEKLMCAFPFEGN